jgi:class 3 adenylate cyclase
LGTIPQLRTILAEDSGARTTVLFADLAGSTELYESAGDVAALAAIEQLRARLNI